MKTAFIPEEITYDGSQLRSHWALDKAGIIDTAIVGFIGPCDVSLDHMVDLIDVRDKKSIYSKNMLHFIVEIFGQGLNEAILWQRILVSLVQQELHFLEKRHRIIRGGNDLYEGEAKLSVSVATQSPVSSLIHFGINITSEGTPIKTKGLKDYDVEPTLLAKSIMESFRHEWETFHVARAKVRAVS